MEMADGKWQMAKSHKGHGKTRWGYASSRYFKVSFFRRAIRMRILGCNGRAKVRICSLMFAFLRKNLPQRHRDTEVQFNGRLNSTRQKIMDELWTHSLPLARPSRAFTFGRMELPLLRSVSQDWMVAVATCKPFGGGLLHSRSVGLTAFAWGESFSPLPKWLKSQAAQVTLFTLSGIVHRMRECVVQSPRSKVGSGSDVFVLPGAARTE